MMIEELDAGLPKNGLEGAGTPEADDQYSEREHVTRRALLVAGGTGAALATLPLDPVAAKILDIPASDQTALDTVEITLQVNGERRPVLVEPRVTLLDALRERLHLTGTKKGCDHGQCGACTVLVDGRRILSCLALAVAQEGRTITTIEGLARDDELHPVQAAFVEHDGLQCGYCTPGQICSAVGMLAEARSGVPSHVTADVARFDGGLSDDEVRERMSGNLCRCGAYANIVAAVRAAASSPAAARREG